MKLLTATFLAFTALSTAALADSPAVRDMNSYGYISKLYQVHEQPMPANDHQGSWMGGEHPMHHHGEMHHHHHQNGEKKMHEGHHHHHHHQDGDKKMHEGHHHHHKHHDGKAGKPAAKEAAPAAQPQGGAAQ